MNERRSNPDFLNGVPELLILRLLARQAMHGYDLVQHIRVQSGQILEFGEGCIYPVLHRLEKQGFLRSQRQPVGGRTRVVYRTTARGLKRLAESTSAWEAVVHAVERVLKGDEHAEPISA